MGEKSVLEIAEAEVLQRLAKAKAISGGELAGGVGLGDCERGHLMADDALREFLAAIGYRHVAEAFDAVEKWYS